MKRMGVLGGISAQATMDFEARVHRIAQRLVPQHRNEGYPPMVVWYHRRPPIRMDVDGRPAEAHRLDDRAPGASAEKRARRARRHQP